VVRKWLLPTLTEILAKDESTAVEPLSLGHFAPEPMPAVAQSEANAAHQWQRALQQWQSGILSLEHLLRTISASSLTQTSSRPMGLLLCAPGLPFDSAELFTTGIFTPNHEGQMLLPANGESPQTSSYGLPLEIPLLPADPLQQDHFCLLLTAEFGLMLSLGMDGEGILQFQYSFDPADVQLAWQSLRGRVMLTANHHLSWLDRVVESFPPVVPNYQWVMKFGQLLLQNLPGTIAERTLEPKPTADLELLQAITHEVRTPLSTIRTLTRSLLRRPHMEEQVIKRLESIDRECTEQINRMELIFQAVEMAEGQEIDLTTMSFSHLMEESLPLWQQQAERRNLNLAVAMPQQLPAVVSNPTILDRVLTGLVENFTRNLPAGSHIQVEVTAVGDRLKLQLHSTVEEGEQLQETSGKAVGQMLTFRPETGNLSLNLKVTQDLFQSLGGKLVVKPNQRQGETMTIFLPMQ
jgi:signal transduction histidine kinase